MVKNELSFLLARAFFRDWIHTEWNAQPMLDMIYARYDYHKFR